MAGAWYAFINDGHVYNLTGVAQKSLTVTGAHGYASESEALQNPNSPASPVQASLLGDFLLDAKLPVGGGVAGVRAVYQVQMPVAQFNSNGTGGLPGITQGIPPGISAPGNVVGGVGQSPSQASSDIAGQAKVSSVLGLLSGGAIWVRVAEVLVGLALLGVGLNALLKGKPAALAGYAAGPAKLAGKALKA